MERRLVYAQRLSTSCVVRMIVGVASRPRLELQSLHFTPETPTSTASFFGEVLGGRLWADCG